MDSPGCQTDIAGSCPAVRSTATCAAVDRTAVGHTGDFSPAVRSTAQGAAVDRTADREFFCVGS